MNNKVPFNQLRYGTRFKYRDDDKQVFVRLGHDLVGDWDGSLHAVACNRQGLYCFKDDTTPLDTPVCVVENSEPVPVAMPDGWKLVPITPTPEMVKALKARLMVTSRGGILSAGVSLADAIAAAPACLDKVKEMSQ